MRITVIAEGPSGCGKTTIIKDVEDFFRIKFGEVSAKIHDAGYDENTLIVDINMDKEAKE